MHYRAYILRSTVLFYLILGNSFAWQTITAVHAAGERVAVPTAVTLLSNTPNVALSDDFDVTASGDVMVFVQLAQGSSSTLSMSTTSGLALEAESAGWTNQSALRFHGSVADANAALDSLTINTQLPESTVLTVTVTAHDSDYRYLPSTGHFYRQMSASGIRYFDAASAAPSLTVKSRPGYLVTITNDAEYNLLLSLMTPSDELWIGLTDDGSEGNWWWWSGPESGTTTTYTRWCSGQPNGNWLFDQDYVFFSGSARGACWTDSESYSGDIDGYLVEFGDNTPFTDFFSATMPINVVAPTATPTATDTATSTNTPSLTNTPSRTNTPLPTDTRSPSHTETSTPSVTVTTTPSASGVATATDTLQPATNTRRPRSASATQTGTHTPSMAPSSQTRTPIGASATAAMTIVATQTTELTSTSAITDSNDLSGAAPTADIVTQLLTDGVSGTQIKILLRSLQGRILSATQARALAADTQVLLQATDAQASQIFAAIDTSTLEESQEAAIIAAVQTAPTEVRQAFETQINLFGDGFNSYIPLGSKVPIETRRALILTGIATIAVVGGAPRIRRRNK